MIKISKFPIGCELFGVVPARHECGDKRCNDGRKSNQSGASKPADK